MRLMSTAQTERTERALEGFRYEPGATHQHLRDKFYHHLHAGGHWDLLEALKTSPLPERDLEEYVDDLHAEVEVLLESVEDPDDLEEVQQIRKSLWETDETLEAIQENLRRVGR